MGFNFKETLLFHEVDNKGRLIIPKEIQRALSIKEGDSFQIFLDKNKEAILFQRVGKELSDCQIKSIHKAFSESFPDVKLYLCRENGADLLDEMRVKENFVDLIEKAEISNHPEEMENVFCIPVCSEDLFFVFQCKDPISKENKAAFQLFVKQFLFCNNKEKKAG